MLITEFTSHLERIIPLQSVGYERDAVGFQVGLPKETRLTTALFAYEVTEEVVEEARENGANLIVAFHPLIFPTLQRVTTDTRTGALVYKLIQSGIALYVQHTAFDAHPKHGTSRLMAEVLQLEKIEPLAPLKNVVNKITVFVPHAAARAVSEAMAHAGAGKIGNYEECSFSVEGQGTFRGNEEASPTIGAKHLLESVAEVRLEMACEKWNTARTIRAMIEAHPYEEVAYDIIPLATDSVNFGMGAIGELAEPQPMEVFLHHVKEVFNLPVLRVSNTKKDAIKKVGLLGGAGMEFYGAALSKRVDAFITADVRYHDFYRAEHDKVLLIDAGHSETERFVAQGMAKVAELALMQAGADAKGLVNVSKASPNAVHYFM